MLSNWPFKLPKGIRKFIVGNLLPMFNRSGGNVYVGKVYNFIFSVKYLKQIFLSVDLVK